MQEALKCYPRKPESQCVSGGNATSQHERTICELLAEPYGWSKRNGIDTISQFDFPYGSSASTSILLGSRIFSPCFPKADALVHWAPSGSFIGSLLISNLLCSNVLGKITIKPGWLACRWENRGLPLTFGSHFPWDCPTAAISLNFLKKSIDLFFKKLAVEYYNVSILTNLYAVFFFKFLAFIFLKVSLYSCCRDIRRKAYFYNGMGQNLFWKWMVEIQRTPFTQALVILPLHLPSYVFKNYTSFEIFKITNKSEILIVLRLYSGTCSETATFYHRLLGNI